MVAELIMIIDLSKCMNCRACTVSCQAENSIPIDSSNGKPRVWNDVIQYELEGSGVNLKMFTLPKACQHCNNAPCVQVCPVGASWKDERNGIVHINHDICIGCRYCMVACPYNVRVFNWEESKPKTYDNPLVPVREKGVVEKCTFCSHKTIDSEGVPTGVLPECVYSCVGNARKFGDLKGNRKNDIEVQKIIETRNDLFVLKKEKGTNPSVHYLPPN